MRGPLPDADGGWGPGPPTRTGSAPDGVEAADRPNGAAARRPDPPAAEPAGREPGGGTASRPHVIRPHVIVVGGGHAGAEAALAAVRAGARVTLVTLDPAAIGRLSCNPSIGGLAKGQLVREIDALGGLMGVAADAAATQFRMLNTRKGPAVRSPRAQVDRDAYADFVRASIAAEPDIAVVAGQVAAPLVRADRLCGMRLADGRELAADAAVLTTGTFLRGLMHVGERVSAGGRVGEAPAAELSGALSALGLQLVRLKTGTPPRIDARSVDLSSLPVIHGAPDDGAFSFRVAPPPGRTSVPTRVTRTTPWLHEHVRAHLHLSPYGRGALEGTGPRYCPSLEDKVVRFGDRDGHRVFIERETRAGHSLYLNGLSMCLPAEVQERIVRAVPGLQRARMLRPGYAVEYDAVPARQLQPTLECRAVRGLFLAGQLNGTSGYEEAAAQGLMAGLNAARSARGLPGVVLSREQAYIGVLVDDLVAASPTEPYRMFTSRAEHRLVLRHDNADRRLVPLGHAWGLVDAATHARLQRREQRLAAARAALDVDDLPACRRVRAGEALGPLLAEQPNLSRELAAAVGAADVEGDPDAPGREGVLDEGELEQVELDLRYAGYVERARRLLERIEAMSGMPLPERLDARLEQALSKEAVEVLRRSAPADLGRAARLPGVTPADVQLLALALEPPAAAPRRGLSR